MAPKRRKTTNDGLGSVVAEYRQNKNGSVCGPYYYWYRYQHGTRTKTYLPREEGVRKQAQLQSTRDFSSALAQLTAMLTDMRKEAGIDHQERASPTGRYWHGSDLRSRRDFSMQERDRALFNLNRDEIYADLGFPISENDYVELMRRVRSELAKLSQQGIGWRDGVTLDMDLSDLPSWRAWVR
ncbi:MAG: hypothetical protein GX600_07555 [Dehalococcoidia bacterium]|nr:hypothetical protein [Dehalococcoidia bacterium]